MTSRVVGTCDRCTGTAVLHDYRGRDVCSPCKRELRLENEGEQVGLGRFG